MQYYFPNLFCTVLNIRSSGSGIVRTYALKSTICLSVNLSGYSKNKHYDKLPQVDAL
jgi:hypothetical protein